MATAYSLKQCAGGTATSAYTSLYSTGTATTAIVSNLLIANQGTASLTIRVGTDTAGAAAPGNGEWLLYDVVVAGNDTLSFGPLSMGTSLALVVSSSGTACTFSAAVAEIS